MTSASEKLAEALEALKLLQDLGKKAIKSKDLSRFHRERLVKSGFLMEVMKGWYIPTHPNLLPGDSTPWYVSFWDFCAQYYHSRFGDNWCLSPEQSILLHVENWTVPKQLLICTPNGSNNIIKLPFDTSLFDLRNKMPQKNEIVKKNGMNIYSVAAALIYCSPKFFIQAPADCRALLASVRDPSALLRILLEGSHSNIASRLISAFRNVGNTLVADQINDTMKSLFYDIRDVNPFTDKIAINFATSIQSPYVNRMRILWQQMRVDIIKKFPTVNIKETQLDEYLIDVDAKYLTDAYHSLSIEGYHVSTELLNRVRSGAWNPYLNKDDQESRNALAARGYWQAFQVVKTTLIRVIQGENSGLAVKKDHRNWYRELFAPCATANILQEKDLAGYRNSQVYIRGSKHVPPNKDAILDLMPLLFELLEEETEMSVRVILGHFFFVYIHPYMDGNGRMGRFLMNIMFASGGYPWLTIKVDDRQEYMQALEAASTQQNILPFCEFIVRQLVV